MIDRVAHHRTAIELAAAESGPWVRHLTQHAVTYMPLDCSERS
jgi:hypothetical protein